MNGPIGTVRMLHEGGGVGHIDPAANGPLEVWTGSAGVPIAELLDNHDRFLQIQMVFRIAGRLKEATR